MYSYVPKISHAILTALFCLACMLLGIRMGGKYQVACNLVAAGFAIITATVLILLVMEKWGDNISRVTDFMRAWVTLDEEGRVAVAGAFPSIHWTIHRGKVVELFEDTSVPMEYVQRFLADSDQKQIAPERNWNSAERPRWAWLEIKMWLEDNRKIFPDSAAGSHSWLWVGNSYQWCMAYYWRVGRKLVDMSEAEA